MQQVNKHGLSRVISADVKREIRVRSKFGCVMCRCGIYQYEHIDPEFCDATAHDPARMCCLCGRCHDKVTRGQLSKAAVAMQYQRVQKSDDLPPPREFFDFHTGAALLSFGSLTCKVSPQTVFAYNNDIVFTVLPGEGGMPGAITAHFYDDAGRSIFEIQGNEWIGPSAFFDLEIIGQRFTIRMPNQRVALQLRHDAPGTIAIERMDMRYKDIHILASEYDFAVGRYNGYGDTLVWLHVKARIDLVQLSGAVIRITTPQKIFGGNIGISAREQFGIIFNPDGRRERACSSDERLLNFYDPLSCGLYWPALGFKVAEGCGFSWSAFLSGVCTIQHARRYFFSKNRVNAPSLFLPATFNAETVKKEEAAAVAAGRPESLLPEPFLVKKDKNGWEAWRRRRLAATQPFRSGTFLDDEPGLLSASGLFKLVDSYKGPLVKVSKEGLR